MKTEMEQSKELFREIYIGVLTNAGLHPNLAASNFDAWEPFDIVKDESDAIMAAEDELSYMAQDAEVAP